MSKRFLIGGLVFAVIMLGLIVTYSDHATAPPPTGSKASSHTDETLPPTASSSFNKQAYSTTAPDSPWVIVNKRHPLVPRDYAPRDLVAVGHGQYLRTEAAAALKAMIADAKAAGLNLTPASAYRSYTTQVSVYDSEVKAYGQARADSESARPGYSEHQTGWAVDITGGGCGIEDCFGKTPEGRWAAAHAYNYGFIVRYTTANASTTGYRAEPWHFRYVGKLLAGEMQRQHSTSLEQFFDVTGGATY